MRGKVKLEEIIEALDGAPEEIAYYLDKRSMELFQVTDEDLQAAEDDDPISDYPDWQHDSILKAREVLREPDHFLSLPDKFDVHEYQIMEDFCLALADRPTGENLLRLIKGSGAFRRFRNSIHSMDIENAWYEFKRNALEGMAIEWLEENGIPYTRDDAIDVSDSNM